MQNLQPPPDDISSSSSTTHAQGDAVATAAAAAAAATAAPATQSKPMISEKRRFQNRESQRKYREKQRRRLLMLEDIAGVRPRTIVLSPPQQTPPPPQQTPPPPQSHRATGEFSQGERNWEWDNTPCSKEEGVPLTAMSITLPEPQPVPLPQPTATPTPTPAGLECTQENSYFDTFGLSLQTLSEFSPGHMAGLSDRHLALFPPSERSRLVGISNDTGTGTGTSTGSGSGSGAGVRTSPDTLTLGVRHGDDGLSPLASHMPNNALGHGQQWTPSYLDSVTPRSTLSLAGCTPVSEHMAGRKRDTGTRAAGTGTEDSHNDNKSPSKGTTPVDRQLTSKLIANAASPMPPPSTAPFAQSSRITGHSDSSSTVDTSTSVRDDQLLRLPDPIANSFRVAQLSFLAAYMANAAHLGLSSSAAAHHATESPFFVHGAAALSPEDAVREQDFFHTLKPDLQPCATQIMYSHHPFLDVLPFRTFRERAILLLRAEPPMFDQAELCRDLLNDGLVCWGSTTTFGCGGGGRSGAAAAAATASRGPGSGTPWDIRSWEARPWFLKKWWMVAGGKGCEMESQSRWWYEMRGEKSSCAW